MREAVALPVALATIAAALILARVRSPAPAAVGATYDGAYTLVPDALGFGDAPALPLGPWVPSPDQLANDREPIADAGAVYDFSIGGAVDAVSGFFSGAPRWITGLERSGLVAVFDQASAAARLPRGLLARVAWQESRYRVDAYNAGSGAAGIMQIVPRWHPGVDPYDARAAIPYAAAYLRRLYDRFGSWALALCAYNWGEGNLSRAIGSAGSDDPAALLLPLETRAYYRDVLADVNAWAGGGLA